MCGIVGFTGHDRAADFLLDGLSKLEYRGYDSAGIAVLNGKNITVEKTVDRVNSLIEKTDAGKSVQGSTGIGHTRWATHGAPSDINAHPHLSADGKFAVVHNGIIENYIELRRELEEDGVTFLSETDTEVIPHLLSKYYGSDLKEAVIKTAGRLKGSYAVGIICTDYPDTLMAVKNFSPLIVGAAKDENVIASDITAVVSVTRDIICLEDGEIAQITPQNIRIYGMDGKEKKHILSEVTWDLSAAEKGGYDRFMMKEIKEQPYAVRQTFKSHTNGREIVFEGLSLDAEFLRTIKRIDIVACGSAYHAGMVGKYVFEEVLRIPVSVDYASEYRYRNPITGKDVLTIIMSQSGETADTLAALREAKQRGSHTLAIVNVVGSSIANAADDVIYTWAGPEIAVATTKGYTTQLCVLYMLAIWAARKLEAGNPEETEKMFDALSELPELMKKQCQKKKELPGMQNV